MCKPLKWFIAHSKSKIKMIIIKNTSIYVTKNSLYNKTYHCVVM